MKARRVKRYGTIIADPPWPERGGGRIVRGAQQHYPLMTVEEIRLVMIRHTLDGRAAPDSHLYLWVTNNFLPSGFAVMAACDYRYVTCITWFKDRVGLGQYFRGVTEHCLFGVRGRPGYRFMPSGTRAQGRTGFSAPRQAHSQKPNQIHMWAEIVSPGPYLELFARAQRPGWDAWGNEL